MKKNGADVVITDTSVDSVYGVGNGSKQSEGGSRSDVDSGMDGDYRQHDGMHRPPTFASFLHEESIVESYVLISWKKIGVKIVVGDRKGFFFIQFSFETGLEGVLEHDPWLICNDPFILRKWTPSSQLSKEELRYVLIWIKFHGVLVVTFTTDVLNAIATRLGSPVMLVSYTVTT
ncbi:zinc knuckle CX2CX4HX4C containing protein, partial [Tanacetum coccineum]